MRGALAPAGPGSGAEEEEGATAKAKEDKEKTEGHRVGAAEESKLFPLKEGETLANLKI